MERRDAGRPELPRSAVVRDLAAWVPYAALVLCTWATTPDDAFIPLRVARNVWEGHGPVFNPGEAVEGFSSPLHVGVSMAVVAIPGSYSLLAAKLLSLAFGALAVWCALRLLAVVGIPWWTQVLGAVLVGTSVPLAVASSNAMETSMVSALVTAAVLVVVRWGTERWVLLGVLGAALVLARPEGALVVGLMGAAIAVGVPRERLGRSLRWLTLPAGTAVVVVVGRVAYYGDALPNTWWAKRQPFATALRGGVGYLGSTASTRLDLPAGGTGWWLGMAVLVAAAALFLAGAVVAVRARQRVAVGAAAVGAQVVFVLVAGGDWMGSGRFVAPVVPVVVVLQAVGARWWADAIGEVSSPSVGRVVVVAAIAVVVLVGLRDAPLHPVWSLDGVDDVALVGEDANRWAEALTLFDCAGPGDLVAYSEMGFVPWMRPGVRFLDTRGLMDRSIARNAEVEARNTWGIADPDWRRRDAPTVREVMRRRPVLVVTYQSDGPASFGNGRYVLAEGGPDVPGYAVYRRSDHRCR